MTEPSPVRPGNAQFASAATVRLGHLIFQTKRWNEAIRMADLKGAVAITMRVLFGRTTSCALRPAYSAVAIVLIRPKDGKRTIIPDDDCVLRLG